MPYIVPQSSQDINSVWGRVATYAQMILAKLSTKLRWLRSDYDGTPSVIVWMQGSIASFATNTEYPLQSAPSDYLVFEMNVYNRSGNTANLFLGPKGQGQTATGIKLKPGDFKSFYYVNPGKFVWSADTSATGDVYEFSWGG